MIPEVVVVADVATALRVGPAIGRAFGDRLGILLRDRAATARAILAAARELRPRVDCLLVSDRADVASLVGADGVHLPERGIDPAAAREILGAEALVGASRHDPAGLAAAFAAGCDYATLSPIWESPGKGTPIGPEALADALRGAPGPVLALGGVDADRALAAVRAGAWGVAAVRAVTLAADPVAAADALLRAVRRGKVPER